MDSLRAHLVLAGWPALQEAMYLKVLAAIHPCHPADLLDQRLAPVMPQADPFGVAKRVVLLPPRSVVLLVVAQLVRLSPVGLAALLLRVGPVLVLLLRVETSLAPPAAHFLPVQMELQ